MDAEQKQIIANAMAEELSLYANKNAPNGSKFWTINFDGSSQYRTSGYVHRIGMIIIYTDKDCKDDTWIPLREPRIS